MRWENRAFDEIGTIARGKSRHRPRNDQSLYGGIYPFIQTGDIKAANLYITEYTQTYSEKGLEQSKLWKANTLCITIAANIADTTILGIDACFPDSVIGFVADENECDVRFIKYYFDVYQKHMQMVSQGATQDNLSLEKLMSFKVPCPPLQVQQKIASILSSYDVLIENNNKRVQLLEEAAQNIYNEWFVNFRFPGYQNVMFEKGLPRGWVVKRTDELFDIRIGKTPPRNESEWFNDPVSGVQWVSISDIGKSSLFLLETKETITQDGVNKFNMNVAKVGTVIVSFKLTVGKVAIVSNDMVTNEAIAHFNIKTSVEISAEYVYFYLKLFEYDTLGSTSSIGKAINSDIIRAIPFLQPDSKLMKTFSMTISPYFYLIKNLLEQNLRLKEARDILLPRLMNGTITM